jgi:drug/metabolite transporter (DMT)-like permease
MRRDLFKLHFVVLLAGFTAVLGKLISLPAVPLVFWRTLIAAACLFALVSARAVPQPAPRERVKLVANGALIGLHWVLFFLAVKLSNVSVCMVGMATIAFWTAFLEPFIRGGRRVSAYEVGLGLVIVAAVVLITRSGFKFAGGLAVAVASALVATVFSVLNSGFTTRHHHWAVAAWEMLGAFAFCALCLPLSPALAPGAATVSGAGLTWLPKQADVLWLLVLALACTVYAYSQYVELLRRLSVFTVHVAYHLEPVYGIVFGAVFFREYHDLNPGFYAGAALVIAAVAVHPFVGRAAAPAGGGGQAS